MEKMRHVDYLSNVEKKDHRKNKRGSLCQELNHVGKKAITSELTKAPPKIHVEYQT